MQKDELRRILTSGDLPLIRETVYPWLYDPDDDYPEKQLERLALVEVYFAAIRLNTMDTDKIAEFLGETDKNLISEILDVFRGPGVTPEMMLHDVVGYERDTVLVWQAAYLFKDELMVMNIEGTINYMHRRRQQ